jgi:hypothetical protein
MPNTINRGYPIPQSGAPSARLDVANNTAPAIVQIDADMKVALDNAAAAQAKADAAIPKSSGGFTGPLTGFVPAGQQTWHAIARASDNIVRWRIGIETNQDLSLWSYNDDGTYRARIGFTRTGDLIDGGGYVIANKPYVDASIAALVNGAEGALDTIKELAVQMRADEAGVTALVNTVSGKTSKTAAETIAAQWTFNVGMIVANDWYRVVGNTGILWNNFGGGWHMTDTTWMRSYQDKSIVTGGAVRAGTFEISSGLQLISAAGRYTSPPLSTAMSQDAGATMGSFVCRASGAGDSNLAAMTFYNDAYAIKLGVRADGYFGLGGWSRAAWSWYTTPAGDMVAAGNVVAYSDPRLKENFERVANPIALIQALDGGTFNWKSGIPHTAVKAGKRDYGILANQVEAVMPEIVTDSIDIDGEVYKTVDYSKLVPVLIEALKATVARLELAETKLIQLTEQT